MPNLAPSEITMWETLRPEVRRDLTDEEINQKYSRRELRIVTEMNREQLPNFVEALKRPNWMDLRPFYQRRKRWDDERKSRLIESFVMNLPVPPLFVYESDFAKYEVMDGQQRITAIAEFYGNHFPLTGLDQWPELNGRHYHNLPSEIKKGLDRRSISYIVLLKESAATTDEETLLRQQVFERLNTGGVRLKNQEIRHCIYHSDFDDLLMSLTKHAAMRRAWGLPPYDPSEETNPTDTLLEKEHYSSMRDAEVILRFFALRHANEYRGGMQSFLDQYMVRSRRFTKEDVAFLRELFMNTIALAEEVYGEHLFHPWDAEKEEWSKGAQIAYADAVMVGSSQCLESASVLRERKDLVILATKELLAQSPKGTFTGQRNTKGDVQHRITLFKQMLNSVASS